MTFAQQRNRQTTHFSERIPVVKRRMSVLSDKKFRPQTTLTLRRTRHVTNCWKIYGMDARGIVVRFTADQENFLYCKKSRLAMGPTHPPTQRVPPSLPTGVKRLGHEADQSFTCSAEVNN